MILSIIINKENSLNLRERSHLCAKLFLHRDNVTIESSSCTPKLFIFNASNDILMIIWTKDSNHDHVPESFSIIIIEVFAVTSRWLALMHPRRKRVWKPTSSLFIDISKEQFHTLTNKLYLFENKIHFSLYFLLLFF